MIINKININDIRLAPKQEDDNLILCCYGELNTSVKDWVNYHNFETKISDKYINIIISKNIELNSIFNSGDEYEYVDGFSPNLNKHLHIGHLSNFILAKSFQKLNIGNNYIAILGDTIKGKITKEESLNSYLGFIEKYDYKVDNIFYASEQYFKDKKNILKDGEGEYKNTKVFELKDGNIVGIKSDKSTSYFYQDVALVEKLSDSVLYLTGNEQENHFNKLKEIYPRINHLGLGLVRLDNKEISSRNGDVIFASDLIDNLKAKFDNNEYLVYNILAGQVLKSSPKQNKEIKSNQLDNPKTSLGLYLSYTLARMKNTNLNYDKNDYFNDLEFRFLELKSKVNLNPSLLFNSLVKLCKEINNLYGKYSLKDDISNEKYFKYKVSDLEYGMKILGLYSIDKV